MKTNYDSPVYAPQSLGEALQDAQERVVGMDPLRARGVLAQALMVNLEALYSNSVSYYGTVAEGRDG